MIHEQSQLFSEPIESPLPPEDTDKAASHIAAVQEEPFKHVPVEHRPIEENVLTPEEKELGQIGVSAVRKHMSMLGQVRGH